MLKKRLRLLSLSAVIAFVLADLALTFFVFEEGRFGDRPLPPFGAMPHPRQRGWLEYVQRELDNGVQRQGAGVFDRELGWTNSPFAPNRENAFCISSGGARGRREYTATIPDGVTRVLTFGDSFTYCAEVPDVDAWQHQLEVRRRDMEVLNFGVGGYGTDQALLRFRRVAPNFDAHAILIGINVENIARNVNRYRPVYHPRTGSAVCKPRFLLVNGELELLPSPFETRGALVNAVADGSVLEAIREHEYWFEAPSLLDNSGFGRLLRTWSAYSRRQPDVLWGDESGEPFRVTLAILEAFAAEANAKEPRFVGVVISHRKGDLGGARFWKPLCDALDHLGIAWLDLSETLAPALARGESLYTGGHLSRRGNELSAAAIETFLAPAFEPDDDE